MNGNDTIPTLSDALAFTLIGEAEYSNSFIPTYQQTGNLNKKMRNFYAIPYKGIAKTTKPTFVGLAFVAPGFSLRGFFISLIPTVLR
ncbi:MAG: hypothetical protein AAF915_24940 [Cyanobacteria bacterium P01_D01_bin.50]